MRKIKNILIGMLLLASMSLLGQQYYVPQPNSIETINITYNQIQNGWALYGNSCAGCASYYYSVMRSSDKIQAEDGIYYYYFYFNFFSNSYYANGSNAGTYISSVSFYADGNFVFSTPYILAPAGQSTWGAWMRNVNGNVQVSFNPTNINVH